MPDPRPGAEPAAAAVPQSPAKSATPAASAAPGESRNDRLFPLRLLVVIVVAALIGSILVMVLR